LRREKGEDMEESVAEVDHVEEEEGEVEEEEDTVVNVKKPSAFALAMSSSDESEEEEEDTAVSVKTHVKSVSIPSTSTGGGKGKGKKKKKGRKGKTPTVNEEEVELLDSLITEMVAKEESSESLLKEDTPSCSSSSSVYFQIDNKCLNEVNELKMQFGAHAVEEDRREKAVAVKRKGGHHQPSHNLHIKHLVLVTPELTWGRPPTRVGGGFGMSLKSRKSEGSDKVLVFDFEYSSTYESLQHQYNLCVQTYDPNAIAELLRWNPYHVDAMLQLADILQVDPLHPHYYTILQSHMPCYLSNSIYFYDPTYT
jgi:hypothetical protein